MIGDIPVKASKVNRKCSRKALEAKFGVFESPEQPEEPVARSEVVQEVSVRRPLPMDDDLLALWQQFRDMQERQRLELQARAKQRRRERAAVAEHVRAEIRRASKLVQEARRLGRHFMRGTMRAIRMAVEMDGRQQRQAVSLRQQRALPPTWRVDSFASWLTAQGHPDLAERWRRRLTVTPISMKPASTPASVDKTVAEDSSSLSPSM